MPGFIAGDPVELPIDVALGKVDYYEAVGFSDHLATSERLVPAAQLRVPHPRRRRHRRHGQLRLAPRPGGHGPRLREDRAAARARALSGGHQGRAHHGHERSARRAGRPRRAGRDLDGARRRDRPARGEAPSSRPASCLRSIVPVDQLEVVASGTGRRHRCPSPAIARLADAVVRCPVDRSGWLVLRAYAQHSRHPVLDLYPFATTSPVYVTVGGAPVRSPEDARYFLGWIDRVSGVRGAPIPATTPPPRRRPCSRRSPTPARCGRDWRRRLPETPRLPLRRSALSAGDHGDAARGQQPRQALVYDEYDNLAYGYRPAQPRPGAARPAASACPSSC